MMSAQDQGQEPEGVGACRPDRKVDTDIWRMDRPAFFQTDNRTRHV